MNCKEIQENISLYIDNKLSLQEIEEIKKHLETCNECKEEYNAIKNIKLILNKLPKKQPSDTFTANVMNKIKTIQTEKENKIIPFKLLKKHFVMAAGFLFIVISSSLFFMNNINNKVIQKQDNDYYTDAAVEYCLDYDTYDYESGDNDYEQYILSMFC